MRLFVIILLFSGSFISTNPPSSDPEEMILGKWHAENDSTFVWEFYENGQHFTYSDDELISERAWQIVSECEGETAENKEDFAMLEIGRGNNLPSQCYVVQGLNGVLTLLAIPQGRLLIFDRVEKWTDNLATEKASAHQDTVNTSSNIFNPILSDLDEVNIPLRLPTYFASETFLYPDKPLFGIIESVNPDSYEIQIAATEDCRWNTFCWVGTVSANTSTELDLTSSEKVQLTNGLQAHFIASTCTSSCSMSKIIWTENENLYLIEQRGALKETMILIANSAIENSVGN